MVTTLKILRLGNYVELEKGQKRAQEKYTSDKRNKHIQQRLPCICHLIRHGQETRWAYFFAALKVTHNKQALRDPTQVVTEK